MKLKKTMIIAITACVVVAFAACKKEKKSSTTPLFTGNSTGDVPALTTTAVTGITSNSAISGGAITSIGADSIIEQGVCWATTQNPVVSGLHVLAQAVTGNNFVCNISGLTANTTYYVRAYATNSKGTGYGNQINFTTTNIVINLPTITTTSASSITQTTATSGGNVTADGGGTITARGVCWSTSQNPTTANNTTSDGTGTGTFTSNITGLQAGTTYYVRAYATNSAGTAYGSQITFTTSNGGTAMGEVTNPITGKTWMDKNLGASRVAKGITDKDADGDLYQWGRINDGHQLRISTTTNNLSFGDKPGHNIFIVPLDWPYDWRSPQNGAMWPVTNNPCPNGFRLPTKTELEEELASWSSQNAAGAYASPLKLTESGFRSYQGYFGTGSGLYWSSTVVGTVSWSLRFGSNYADIVTQGRANGASVRCIKN